jgi:glycine/D-amino acid oxidase-like deaminating enzyme
MTQRAIAVIGAGIVGCLIARELAAADQDVAITVLERDLIGAGATRRSAGLALARGSTPRTRRMSAFSQRYYSVLQAAHRDLPIYPVDGQVIADGAARPAELGYLTAGESASEPGPAGYRLPDGMRAWPVAGCHYADVYSLTGALAAQARPRVRFAEGLAVTGLTPTAAGLTIETSSGEELQVDQVVLAPGPWLAAPAWGDLVSPLGLRVKKIVAMHVDRPPGPADELIIFEQEDAFLLPLRHRGHWLFSYTCTEWDVEPDELTGGLSAANVSAAQAVLARYAPELADDCTTGRVCCDAYSPTREPVITALDADQRIVFAGGANGSGYRLGPAIATSAVALLNHTASEFGFEGATDDHQYV